MEEALNELYLYSSCLVNTHIPHRDISSGNLLDLSHFRDLQFIADVTYWAQYNYHGVLDRRTLDLMRLNLIPNRIQNLELWLFTESDDYMGLAAVKRALLLLNLYSDSKDRCSELKSLTINIQYDRGYVTPPVSDHLGSPRFWTKVHRAKFPCEQACPPKSLRLLDSLYEV